MNAGLSEAQKTNIAHLNRCHRCKKPFLSGEPQKWFTRRLTRTTHKHFAYHKRCVPPVMFHAFRQWFRAAGSRPAPGRSRS